MQDVTDLPITISLPQGFTIGGVTTWALATARHLATTRRAVRLIAHAPLAGHATFDPAPALVDARVEIIEAPCLAGHDGFKACVDIYAAQLPTLLFPNLCAESYAIAAELSRSRARDLRVVSWIHGDNPIDYAYLEHFEPIIHRYIAVSRQCRAQMQNRLPNRADDIACVPCGVEIAPVVARTPPTNRSLRIAYAGRIEQGIKRVIDLLAIGLSLATQGRRFEMRIVGDGPHADMLDARIAALAPRFAKRNCTLARERARPPHAMNDVWQWADVFLLTSRLEGFSVSMLEAMAAGCIPVVTRIDSGVGEMIRDDFNGLTFPIGDIDTAASQLARIADNPELCTSMSANARASAIARAGIDQYIERVEPILQAASFSGARIWPASRALSVPSAESMHGAIPHIAPSDAYEAVVDFIMSRPDAAHVVVYGLGVNGLTLIERLRTDAYLGNRTLHGIDDDAHAAIFETMGLPRFELAGRTMWPHDAIAVITPNAGATIAERLQLLKAEQGVDFVRLHASRDGERHQTDSPREPISC